MRCLLVFWALTSLLLSAPARACDLCSPPPPEFRTIQAELRAANTVVLADRAGSDMSGRPNFVIREVLRGGTTLAPGQTVSLDESVPDSGVFFLFGDRASLDARPPRRIEQDVAEFATLMARAPVHVAEKPDAWGKWLAKMVPYLESEDALIATSAGQEFANAPFIAIRAVRGRVKADAVMDALENPRTPRGSRGALALVAGICAEESHTPRLEALLREERFRATAGFHAIVAGYLLARGPDGLAVVRKLLDERLAAGDARTGLNVLAALRFHAQNAERLSRAQVLGEVRRMLAVDALGPAAILELATLEDWESLPLVMETFRRLRAKGPMVLGPTARFVQECPLPDAQAAREEVMGRRPRGDDSERE